VAIPITEEQYMVQLMTRDFARNEIEPVSAENDKLSRFPADVVKKMAQLGLLGMMVPERYGGAGAGAVSYVLAIEEVAWADASTAVTMSVNNLTCEPLMKFGSEEVKEKHLAHIASGKGLGAFCITEAEAGSDVSALRMRAVADGDGWILNGSKVFITNAEYADVFVVVARTGDQPGGRGLSAFVVERDAPGFSVGKKEDKMGLRASCTSEVVFEDCKVPKGNMLGREGDGFRIAMAALDSGRIGIAAQAVGIARCALDEALRYAGERKSFGRAISRHQAIQWMLADAAVGIEAGHNLTLSAAISKDAGEPFTREASIAKLFSTEMVNRVVYDALQIHGGYGYIKDYKIERLYRDARVTTIYEGTSEIQRIVIANHLTK
jgi:butyryl-CoA dehydrogenase